MVGDPWPPYPYVCSCRQPQSYTPFRLDPEADAKAMLELAAAINRLADVLDNSASETRAATAREGPPDASDSPGMNP